jgi:quercetin dioxygenase-like cupin family protein
MYETTGSVQPATLVDVAAGIGRAEQLWRAMARHDPVERRPVRLLATAAYEVWVIGWMPGQEVELHDHGGSTGVVLVVDGELTEQSVEDGRLVRRTLQADDTRVVPPDAKHAVANDGTRPATSIHVYAPPLREMTRFDPATLRPAEVQSVHDEPPVVPPASLTAILAAV